MAADVRDEAAVDMVFEQAREAFGAPTILVNAAGVDAAGIPVADMELDHFDMVLRTNLIGPFLFCRAFVRGCKAAKARGKIINITSIHENVPRAGAADYCASKGGLRNLTRCLALELAEHGISVNNLAPGMVLTPMNQEAIDDPKVHEGQTASVPMTRGRAGGGRGTRVVSRIEGCRLRDRRHLHAGWRAVRSFRSSRSRCIEPTGSPICTY